MNSPHIGVMYGVEFQNLLNTYSYPARAPGFVPKS